MTPTLIQHFRAARRVSVPLVAIATPDAAATIATLCEAVTANRKANEPEAPLLVWDLIGGLRAYPGSEAGKNALGAVSQQGYDDTEGNPVALFKSAQKLPSDSVLFVHMAHRHVENAGVVQALWNLRDLFKIDNRMAVLLGPSFNLPPELAGDVVVFDEPLPDAEALAAIIREQHEAAGLEVGSVEAAVEAVQGLPAFQVEQVVAMSLGKAGLNVPELWERKRQQIEQTPGLKVHRGRDSFADVGGADVVKGFLGSIMHGKSRPNAIVFIDEIEKFMAGAAGGNDSSGVSQDQLGTLLAYMQDHNATGAILVGPAGSGKSAVAKAAGNEGGIPTIQLDLGGMKGSLVGQSEQNLRQALKVVSSVSNNRTLWIATSNGISDLPPELKRRFTLGTFFFDIPDAAERDMIWPIWLNKLGLPLDLPRPDDEGWTGAEIRQCVDIADRLGRSLIEAAKFVVPVSRSAADQLERLRNGAQGKFLSASHEGTYRRTEAPPERRPGRRVQIED